MKLRPQSVFILILSVFLFMGCSNTVSEEYITPEAFRVDILEQSKTGMFEIQGYKNVNTITTIRETKREVHTEVLSVEDIYNLEDNYVKTELIKTTSSSNKNKDLPHDGGNHRTEKKELSSPSTILIPDPELHPIHKLTKEEESEIDKHVRSLIEANF